jgi:hypothetical protein
VSELDTVKSVIVASWAYRVRGCNRFEIKHKKRRSGKKQERYLEILKLIFMESLLSLLQKKKLI